MATEYRLSYKASDVDKKLGQVDILIDKSNDLQRQVDVERARINTFTRLEDGSTTGDGELAEARVDYTGHEWDNVGEHIRGVTGKLSEEIGDIKSDLGYDSKYINVEYTGEGYLNIYGNIQQPTIGKNTDFIEIEQGHDWFISGRGGVNAKNSAIAVFYNETKTRIGYYAGDEVSGYHEYEYENIPVPEGTHYIRFSDFGAVTNPHYCVLHYDEEGRRLDDIEKSIAYAKKVVYVSPDGDDNNDGIAKENAVKTFTKAISLKPKIVYCKGGTYTDDSIIIDGFDEISIMLDKSWVSDSGNVEITTGIELETSPDSASGLLISNYDYSNGDILYNVFVRNNIGKTTTDGGGSIQYSVGVFEIGSDVPCGTEGLLPVSDIATCQSTEGSFFYDGTKFYIHRKYSNSEKFIYAKNSIGTIGAYNALMTVKNCGKFRMDNVVFSNCPYKAVIVDKTNDAEFVNCKVYGTAYGGGFNLSDTNANFYNCESYRTGTDGFGLSQSGTVNFFDCIGAYCRDDGVSHHHKCNGVIDGGEWHHCGKGGIASPTHGSAVDIQNAFVHDNVYGFYIVNDSDNKPRTIRLVNCVAYNNKLDDTKGKDILVTKTDVLAYGCKFETKGVGATASLTEL